MNTTRYIRIKQILYNKGGIQHVECVIYSCLKISGLKYSDAK